MAKKIKVSVTDFLEKTLGMSASAESMRMEHTSRRRNNEIYSKPMNPYRLAKDLADIQADQYRQHAESVTAYAMSEAAARGYGELSVQDVTDKVTEGAKNAWKSFLVLIDKLISVIKEFIRGLFDKEKKIAGVIKKLKTAAKRVADSSRQDSSKEIKIAELSPAIVGFVVATKTITTFNHTSWRNAVQEAVTREGTSSTEKLNGMTPKQIKVWQGEHSKTETIKGAFASGFLRGIIELLDTIKDTRTGKQDVVKSFIIETLAAARNISSTAKDFGVKDFKGMDSVKGSYNKKTDIDKIDLKEYKEDWNIVISDFNAAQKGIVKAVRSKGTTKADEETANENGYNIRKFSRSAATSKAVKASLDGLIEILTRFKQAKINSSLEKCIKALNELRQAIIRNKDSRFSNKYAQLGRVTIAKLTVLYTKSISVMNSIYAACFKVAAVNITAANTLRQKDTNPNNKDTDDYKTNMK